MTDIPRTQYAKGSDGANIAYQVVGSGPLDLVWVPGFVSHLEVGWEEPSYRRFFEGLASFSRVIIFDKRGCGLSDRVSSNAMPTLEQRMDDIRAVMDSVGSSAAVIFGISEGAALSVVFAATYPDKTRALILDGAFVGTEPRPSVEGFEKVVSVIEQNWGLGHFLLTFAPDRAGDLRFREWLARFERMSASPGAAAAILRMNFDIRIDDILPAITIPTLVLHQSGDINPPRMDQYIADRIPGARYVELSGTHHWPWLGDSIALLEEVEHFVTGARRPAVVDRVLATVLFTDIVGSTECAADLGDHKWRDILERFYALSREELAHYRGREVNTTGDGILATFDGPGRAIRCASAITDATRALGIEARAGLHTGECELMGEDVGGIAVHIGARVSGLAGPGETLVSQTVKDLVAGSGIRFEDRGMHKLKGVPDEWRLFAVCPLIVKSRTVERRSDNMAREKR